MTRSARRSLIAASIGTLALSAACAPVITDQPFAPSDGTRADLNNGQLLVNNLFIVTAGPCEPGVLAGAVTSAVAQDVEIEFLPADDAVTTASPSVEDCAAQPPSAYAVSFESAGTVSLTRSDFPDEVVALATVPAIPGGMVGATVSGSVSGTHDIRIPVLDGTLKEYEGLAELAAQQD